MLVICQQCKLKDTDKESMIHEKNKGYYHPVCHQVFLNEKEKKRQDVQELAELCETIKQIHGLEVVPRNFILRLQDYRNGTIRKGKNVVKQKKKGVKFASIKKAWEISKPKIDIAKRTKNFDNDMKELNYCFCIVDDCINKAIAQKKKQKRIEQAQKASEPEIQPIEPEREVEYKKKKYKKDISDLLG